MPIRFRCAYCNQLMGIGRRKAGTVVRCPRCAGEVIVPATPHAQAANGSGAQHPLLEAEDFGKEFADVEMPPAPPNPLMPPPPYAHTPLSEPERRVETSYSTSALPERLRRRGLFLSTPMLLVTGVLLLLMFAATALVFFFLGRWTAL